MKQVYVVLIAALLLALFAAPLGMLAQGAAAAPDALAGDGVTSAYLSIFVTSRSSVETVTVHRVTQAWNENTVTWNSFGHSYDAAALASFTNTPGWQTVDVTALVQTWASGVSPNFGLLLEQGNTPYTTYHSSEYGDESLRPRLDVCWGSVCKTIRRTATTQGAVADAYIWEVAPYNNGGGSDVLYTGRLDNGVKETLIRFELPAPPPPAPAALGDLVWSDANRNGVQDAGEAGIPNVPVQLYTCASAAPVASATTDANGAYHFTDLSAGSYYVGFTAPAGYVFSSQDQGGNDALDSDANPATGQTACVTLSAGETNNTLDAGLYQNMQAPGTGTPGYWFNHPEAWPVEQITIGGVTYSKASAIVLMKAPTAGDVTKTMFQALVSSKLNVYAGNEASCVNAVIQSADNWMATNGPVGSGVKAKTTAWRIGEPLYQTLDAYNNGRLCAPHRG